MSSHDLLLEWASEKGSGTWQALRDAWEWIFAQGHSRESADPAGKAWTDAANLAALGHLEISWQLGGDWAVAPPVLTMVPKSGGRALLTGSRTRTLYRPGLGEALGTGRLAEAAEDLGLWIDDVGGQNGPTSVYVACNEPGDAETLARCCGIHYTYSVGEQLSVMLPPLSAYVAAWPEGDLPQGFPVERYSAEALEWEMFPRDDPEEPGLYRAIKWGEHIHLLITPLGQRLRASREHAVFEVLRWQDDGLVLHHHARAEELWVPLQARLPALQERAAVLCSGRLPAFRRRDGVEGLTYVNVPEAIFRRIAASLTQEPVTVA